MQKDKWSKISDLIVRNCKILFPVIVVAVAAATVVVALNLNRGRSEAAENPVQENAVSGDDAEVQPDASEIPLVANEDSEISSLVTAYYDAMFSGDVDTLRALYDVLPDNDVLRYEEQAKYLDHYTEVQIFTKQGPAEGSVIAYVYYRLCFVEHEEEFPGYENLYICRNDQGGLYIKNEVSFSEEEKDYITVVNAQDDVVEFNNRVNVEYNELIRENPSLLEYLAELTQEVNANIGVTLAEQNVDGSEPGDGEGEAGEPGEGEGEISAPEEPVEPATPQYATATTTVNVRSSDSEQADKLGKASEGTRLQVQEVRVNGWTKVVFEGKDGYIKSEYLQFSESADEMQAIGSVVAKENINIRAAASQTSEKLGMLAGGESLDLLAVEGDWCKVIFNGMVAYVKGEYVEQR